MKTFTALTTTAFVLLLTGCASISDAEPAETISPAAERMAADVDPCTYLAGGTFDDATDFAIAYSTARETADLAQLQDVIERLDTASASASIELAPHLDAALVEFRAIETRLTGGDPLAPVQYETIVESLDRAMSRCASVLEE